MNDYYESLGIALAVLSGTVFVIGVILLIFIDNKKLAGKVILWSIIGFIIGFGTCLANLSIGTK